MPLLYFDNFRGFQKTFLNLLNINFFVGQNSTGKTSVLKLIGIISSPGFWHYQSFSTPEISLGYFSEIVSSDQVNKEYFEIGILGEDPERALSGIKLKFIENDKFPQLKEICFINANINLQVYIEGKDIIKYRYILAPQSQLADKDISFFESWINDVGLNDKQFSRVQSDFIGVVSILFQLQSIIGLNDSSKTANPVLKVRLTLPTFLKDVAWFGPIRTEPARIYSDYVSSFDTQGKHAPYILKEILKEDKNNIVKFILKKFGGDSGLFDEIKVNRLTDENNGSEPFEILIRMGEKEYSIMNVGYGVPQLLPLIVEVIARPLNTWFVIQQPEIHLHPMAQAAFGEFIFKSQQQDQQNFIVETHSDYTIDRYRLRVNRAFREKSYPRQMSQVVFFTRKGNRNTLETITILEDGSYTHEQPKAFREFFIKEQIELLSI